MIGAVARDLGKDELGAGDQAPPRRHVASRSPTSAHAHRPWCARRESIFIRVRPALPSSPYLTT